jgi:4'-phosphopantetheinyl transferase
MHIATLTLPNGALLGWAEPALDAPGRTAALARLSAPERDRAAAMPPAACDSFLVGRVLLREIAAAVAGVPVDGLVVTALCPDCAGPHGAPAIEGALVHVSLSRCAAAVVAVASANGPIGVDVEQRDGGDDRLAAIESLTAERSLRRWTRTEAVLKADGRGLRVDPANVEFDRDTAWVRGSTARYRLSEPELGPGILVSVAWTLET